jgi:CubicO group peptidase (beta-lactamase class C family)
MSASDPFAVTAAAVRDGVVPAAVLVVGRGADDPGRVGAYGTTPDTVFDLASLTKVVATTPAVLWLVQRGALALDDPVVRHLPAFGGPGKDAVTVRHLLAHRSGLPAHREFWKLQGGAPERMAAVLAEPLQDACGTVVRYSDLGFLLLGRIVEQVTSLPLDRAVAELVLEPLGLTDTRFLPPPDWRARIAPTEANRLDGDPRPKTGVVHDENAESLGGVAGHAGLFGTAADLAAYLRGMWLADDSPLSPGLRSDAVTCQTTGSNGRRGLGWTLRGDAFDFMSDTWPAGGAGHTGFTGTSVAFDPHGGAWAVLLTNAVRYGRGNRARELRLAVHEAVASAATGAASGAEASD